MEAELNTLLITLTETDILTHFKEDDLDESLELLEEIFGEEELTIEDWEI